MLESEEEELSAGYLNDGEGGEDEADFPKPVLNSNENSRDFLPRISPVPDNKVLISLSSKSPDVRINKRTVKLKTSESIAPGTTQNSAERTNVGLKPQLGVSSSAKVIENKPLC